MKSFTAEVVKENRLTYIRLPFDAREVFAKPKGAIYVKGTLNGIPYRSKLLSRGKGVQLLLLDKALKVALGFTGQAIQTQVTISLDDNSQNNQPQQGTAASKDDKITDLVSGMELLTAIRTRRSIRKFTDAPVSQEILQAVLYSGLCAPSAKNMRPWHFVTIKDKDTLTKLGENNHNASMLADANCAIVICGDRNLQGTKEFLYADCAAATQNMLLSIHALGLGGVWCGVAINGQWYKQLVEILSLPVKVEPFAVIALGHPAQPKPPAPRYDETKLHNEKW